MDYTLTNNGAVLMTQVAAGRTILFTRTESGSGYSANPAVLQGVIDKKQDMFLEEVLFENRQATIKTVLSNMQLEEGYQLRQVGVYAKLEGDEADTLVIIGQQYNGEKIPPYAEGIIQIEYDIAMKVSGTGNVTIEGVGTGYVTKGQFLAHLNDHDNPHQVTKKQVGLDLVPNVGTDDQTPAFEEAAERENIVSEEKLSVIMGKVRKWFTDLKEAAFCSVANNLVTMLPGSVLDARQGKVLDERISGLYSDRNASCKQIKPANGIVINSQNCFSVNNVVVIQAKFSVESVVNNSQTIGKVPEEWIPTISTGWIPGSCGLTSKDLSVSKSFPCLCGVDSSGNIILVSDHAQTMYGLCISFMYILT